MQRRTKTRIGLGALVAAVVAASLAVSIADDPPVASGSIPVTLISGFHPAGEKFDLGGRTIDRGRYVVGYSLDVRMVSPRPDATLDCELVDLSGALLSIDQPTMTAVADDTWTTLRFSDTRELPESTLSIRCTTTAAGELSASFRNVSINVQKTVFRG